MRPIIVLVSALGLLAGCSKKAPECASLVGVINPAVARMKKASEAKIEKTEDHVTAMNEIARIGSGVSADVGKLPLTVPELRQFSADYQATAGEWSSAARELGEALRSTEAHTTTAEAGAKEVAVASERYIKASTAAGNGKDAAAAQAFAGVLARLGTEAEKPEAVTQIVADLRKITFVNEELRGAAEALATRLETNNKLLAALQTARIKAEAAEKRFEAAANKEDTLIAGINKFCTE